MKIDIVTIFPELFTTHLATSLLGKAIASERLDVRVHDLRSHGRGKHRSVDDEPYGGGAGMVMRPEPFFEMVDSLSTPACKVVLLSARGTRFTHLLAEEMSSWDHLILLCGRYEGVDERVSENLCDMEVSIGDFVLAGGELPALVVVEAVSRLLPGVLGNAGSLDHESHIDGLLEYPQYTRPAEYRGHEVPKILLSGDHAEVERWRTEQSLRLTRERRPDLLGDEQQA